MRLYIIRHGETAWNRERRLQGQTDIPLNAFGEKLAEETGRGLSEVPFDLCIASPLTRTRQTALQVLRENRAFLNRKGRAELSDFCSAEDFRREAAEELAAGKEPWDLGFPLLTDKRIIEIDFGIWEGLGCGPKNMEIPEESFREFFQDPEKVQMPKGGETAAQVKKRTGAFLQELSQDPLLRDKTILIASHGFAVRAMLNPFYEHPEDFWQGHPPYNCAVNLLETDGQGRLRLTDRDRLYYDPSLAANFYGGTE